MPTKLQLNTKQRTPGLLPAVVYGHKIDNTSLSLDEIEFNKVFGEAGENTLIDLKIGDKSVSVLVHDIQKDPLKGNIIHVDFYKPDLEKVVKALVPLTFIGVANAIKDFGGTLVKHANELEVEALPIDLPHQIEVDISKLGDIGDEVFVKDLDLPENVKILKDPEEGLVTVAAPAKVEEELEKPIEEKLEDIEATKEKEKEEEEGEEGEEKKPEEEPKEE